MRRPLIGCLLCHARQSPPTGSLAPWVSFPIKVFAAFLACWDLGGDNVFVPQRISESGALPGKCRRCQKTHNAVQHFFFQHKQTNAGSGTRNTHNSPAQAGLPGLWAQIDSSIACQRNVWAYKLVYQNLPG
jgi:hypothetical protein